MSRNIVLRVETNTFSLVKEEIAMCQEQYLPIPQNKYTISFVTILRIN